MHLTQHLLVGYLLPWGALRERRDRVIVALAGLAPDVDAPLLLAMGRDAFIAHHHRWTHHLAGAALAAAAGAALGRSRGRTAAFAAAAWLAHLLCDLIGGGDRHPGEPFAYPLPLLWPFSTRPFDPFPWAWSLASWQNAVVAAVLLAVSVPLALRHGRTVVELFSPRADGAVVEALRRRFRG